MLAPAALYFGLVGDDLKHDAATADGEVTSIARSCQRTFRICHLGHKLAVADSDGATCVVPPLYLFHHRWPSFRDH